MAVVLEVLEVVLTPTIGRHGNLSAGKLCFLSSINPKALKDPPIKVRVGGDNGLSLIHGAPCLSLSLKCRTGQ